MTVTRIVYGGYEKNPFVKYCKKKLEDQGVEVKDYSLDDLYGYIEKCKHSYKSICLFGDRNSYISDQLRLALMLDNPDMFYLDADCYLNDINNLPKNSVAVDGTIEGRPRVNDGACFYACPEWAKFYFDIYQDKTDDIIFSDKGIALTNYDVHDKWPYPEKLHYLNMHDPNHKWGRHYFVSNFSRYKNIAEDRRVVYYTFNSVMNEMKRNHIFWQLKDCPVEVGQLLNQTWYYDLYGNDDEFRVWQQQLCYTLKNPFLQFVEI